MVAGRYRAEPGKRRRLRHLDQYRDGELFVRQMEADQPLLCEILHRSPPVAARASRCRLFKRLPRRVDMDFA
jgi:hypothetical protein